MRLAFIATSVLAVATGVMCVSNIRAASLYSAPKAKDASVRLMAQLPATRLAGEGANHDEYLAELKLSGDKGAPQVVKLSYRFQIQDSRIPKSYLDYELVHRFRVVRDESCDEQWQSISTVYPTDISGAVGRPSPALIYTSHATAPQFGPTATLACYVVTPADYRGTERSRGNHQPKPSKVENQPRNQSETAGLR